MKVKIKTFAVDMEVKSKGVEFQVHDNKGEFLGDCYVTMTGVEWCPRENDPRQRQEDSLGKIHSEYD